MASLTYQRTVNASCLLGIASAIAMPDVVFGLLAELTHLLFEVLHLAFEVFESMLDHFIEHTFHTNTHDTQVIVFYTIMTMATTGLYFLGLMLSRYFRKVISHQISVWTERKTQFLNYWAESAANKFKLIALFNAGLTTCYIAFSVFV
jgi:hypothetical protein